MLEVASVRIPCNDFKGWMGESGYDHTAWVKRFTAEHRPGPYLRVLEEGVLAAGDPIEVVHRPGHGVTVTTMFRALTTERYAAAASCCASTASSTRPAWPPRSTSPRRHDVVPSMQCRAGPGASLPVEVWIGCQSTAE